MNIMDEDPTDVIREALQDLVGDADGIDEQVLTAHNQKIQQEAQRPWLELLEELGRGEASDGHHTHNELYAYRLAYNALYFNMLAGYSASSVTKSWKHHDGEPCFGVTEEGKRWFIVTAELLGGQVSNHYREEHWDLFKVEEVETAPEWDGHTPAEALERLLYTAREVGW